MTSSVPVVRSSGCDGLFPFPQLSGGTPLMQETQDFPSVAGPSFDSSVLETPPDVFGTAESMKQLCRLSV